MSKISRFETNVAYDNTDINDTIKAITGAGVINIGNDPNNILSAVASSGVTVEPKNCKVEAINDTSCKVYDGIVIMENGSHFVITGTETISDIPSGLNYIIVRRDSVSGNVLEAVKELPTDNYVLLAEFENGVVNDRRIPAISKIENFGGNFSESLGTNIDGLEGIKINRKISSISQDWELVNSRKINKPHETIIAIVGSSGSVSKSPDLFCYFYNAVTNPVSTPPKDPDCNCFIQRYNDPSCANYLPFGAIYQRGNSTFPDDVVSFKMEIGIDDDSYVLRTYLKTGINLTDYHNIINLEIRVIMI